MLKKELFTYSQQQNKWYRQMYVLTHFEATFYVLVVPNLLTHKNITINYYMKVNTFGGTLYFAVECTSINYAQIYQFPLTHNKIKTASEFA